MLQEKNEKKLQTFAARISGVRFRRGWNQQEMAEFIGVSPRSVAGWETATTMPSGASLHKVADKLQVSVAYLIGENDQPGENWSEDPRPYQVNVLERECREHVNRYLEDCGGDPDLLGWTKVELKKHFPLKERMAKVSSDAAVELTLRALARNVAVAGALEPGGTLPLPHGKAHGQPLNIVHVTKKKTHD